MLFDVDKIIPIIRYWSTFQLCIIVFFILLFFLTRIFIFIKSKFRSKLINKITLLLLEIHKEPDKLLTTSVIKFFNRHIFELIMVLDKKKNLYRDDTNWILIKKILGKKVFRNQGKKLAESRNWFNRYLATRCYEFTDGIEDENVISKLINDEAVLTSINAAIIIFHHASTRLINEMITVFSRERRLLQTTLANILREEHVENEKKIIAIIVERLKSDKDPYVRVFCYRLLNCVKSVEIKYSNVKGDLISKDIDLRIAVLKYLAHVDPVQNKSILVSRLADTHDDVRAAVVKSLRNMKDPSLIPYFVAKLKDSVWWVRINSALALSELGDKGRAALSSQSIEKDKFAYETAQAVLKINKER